MNQFRYVGIDVSKDGLDVAVRPGGDTCKFANSAAGIRKLLRRLAALTVGPYLPGGHGRLRAEAGRGAL